MANSKIGIIIEREYLERVKKKSFIFTTILMPLMMLVMMALPAIIIAFAGSSEQTVLVVDNSDLVGSRLKDTEEVKFILASPSVTQDSALRTADVSGILIIPEGIVTSKRAQLKYFSNGPTSVSTEGSITSQVSTIVERERLLRHNIPDLDQILAESKCDVSIYTVRNDEEESEAMSSSLSYGLGIGLSFVLYMFLLIYGQMVMTSIIEEKGNRVLEVVVSSVKPEQLMMGKIIGVALVAITQIVLWGVLLMGMSSFVLPAMLPESVLEGVAAVQSGNVSAISSGDSVEMLSIIAGLTEVGNIAGLLAMMTIFLILGFLIYSSIFAAIGSAVDNIQDASQFSSFAVYPIIFGIIFSLIAAADPMGPVAFWTSMFPLTSPLVMMARIPFGIPAWQIILSLVLLVAGFVGMVWIAAKIYRVGIFMYGKKPTLKEIAKWVRYK